MSRQINFYLTSTDLAALEAGLRQALKSKSAFFILHSRSHTQKPRVVDSIEFLENGRDWPYLYLVRQGDIDLADMRHVPNQGYWVVDVTRSPVIELTKGFCDGSVMKPGRLFYKTSFFDCKNNVIEKSEDFCAWADLAFKETKRRLKRNGAFYIGRDIEEWKSNGGVLAG